LLARSADVIALMRESGSVALGIIAVVNGLVGAILAFVGRFSSSGSARRSMSRTSLALP
jgi:hypothetical protein